MVAQCSFLAMCLMVCDDRDSTFCPERQIHLSGALIQSVVSNYYNHCIVLR